jgi:hypothetical protein
MIIILQYDDGTSVDPKVVEWAVAYLNKAFGEKSQDSPPQTNNQT